MQLLSPHNLGLLHVFSRQGFADSTLLCKEGSCLCVPFAGALCKGNMCESSPCSAMAAAAEQQQQQAAARGPAAALRQQQASARPYCMT